MKECCRAMGIFMMFIFLWALLQILCGKGIHKQNSDSDKSYVVKVFINRIPILISEQVFINYNRCFLLCIMSITIAEATMTFC